MNTNSSMPRQRLLTKEKTDKWCEDTIKAIVENSDFSPGNSTRREELRKTYQYYNGIIDDEDYTHVLRPYGKRRKNMPAQLHNYPILKPVIDLLQGEHRRRPFNFSVVVANDDAISVKNEEKSKVLRENLDQHFVNAMSRAGMTTGMEDPEAPYPEEIAKLFDISYRDARAISGQEALNFISYHQNIRSKRAKMWKHWLISGMVCTKRDIVGSEVVYEVLNPLNVDFDKAEDVEFIEDADWAMVRKMSTRANIIDTFYEYLTPDQIDALENPKSSEGTYLSWGMEDEDINSTDTNIEVIQVYWKAQTKIGIVSYMDEFGEIQEKEVSDTYKVNKEEGETVEWFWVNEVWEGTRIDTDMYINMRKYPVQRESMDNLSICKLPINGRKYSDLNAPNISLLMLGIPYQLNYNIYKLRLETAIAKSKDIIAQLDLNMIPAGWDMDKFMYYVDATGIAWQDYAKEGIKPNPNQKSVLDMSIKTIESYIVLLDSVKQEWEDLSGVSRQRKGDIAQYDGRDATQQSIVQSAMITEELFGLFAEVEQKDLQALIDLSRYAWIGGKSAMYVTSDLSQAVLNVDGIQHMDSEYGVFVSDSARDQEKLEALKGMAQAFVQNGSPLSTVVDMMEATSFVSLKSKISAAEKAMNELEQAQIKAQQEMDQAKIDAERERIEREDVNKELDRKNRIDVAQIGAESRVHVKELEVLDTGDDYNNEQTNALMEIQHQRENKLAREKLAQDERIANKKIEVEKLKVKSANSARTAVKSKGSKK